uniref:Polyadenylate-binding protein 1t n=1 Tax=Euglena gracilis TaxID=3039 RepID=A0AA51UAM2_EUGGR|nr:polyadenylate-binding protein 1t [Euglena gracilis]BDX17161.1 polyadenylate-binding protein 1E [Euglena gracilis]
MEHHPSRNIFVGNLPKWADDEWLLAEFRNFGPILASKVMKKGGTNNSYGFVQFIEASMASKAIEVMNGSPLDDAVLFVKSADHDKDAAFSPTSSTVEATNLPVSFSENDVKALFGRFGALLSASFFTQDSKDSAVVEFATIESAAAAKLVLHGIRLPNHPKPLIVKFADSSPKQKRRNRRRKPVHTDNGPKHFHSALCPMPAPVPQFTLASPTSEVGTSRNNACKLSQVLGSNMQPPDPFHDGRVQSSADWATGAGGPLAGEGLPNRRPPALDLSEELHIGVVGLPPRASPNRFAVFSSDDAPHSPASSVGDLHSDKSDRDDRALKCVGTEEPVAEYQLFAGFSHVRCQARCVPQKWG